MTAPEKSSKDAPPEKRNGAFPIYVAIGVAIVGIGVFAAVFAWFFNGGDIDFDRELSSGLQKLKREVSPEVRRLALSIELKDLTESPAQSKWELILGAIALDDSEKSAVRERALALAEEALKHLKASQKLGFPRGYDGLANFLLGKVLYELFQWSDAIEPLEIAATEWPAGRAEALSRLVDIDLATEGITQPEVLERLDFWKGLVGLSPEDRNREGLKRIAAEIAFGDYSKAIELASQFPTGSVRYPEVLYQTALAKFLKLSASGNEAQNPALEANLTDVYKEMKGAAKAITLNPAAQRQNQYYMGVVLQRLNRWEESIGGLSVLRQSSPHTVEGLAAAIAEMKALIKLQRFDEVIGTARQVYEQFGKLEWYNNSWQPIPVLRNNIKEIGQELLVNRAYPQVIEYSAKMPPFCDRQDRLRLISVGYGRWAKSLRGKPDTNNSEDEAVDIRVSIEGLVQPEDESLRDETNAESGKRFWQKLFNESAKSYEELAFLQMRSPEYFDLIWEAIKNYQASGDLMKCNLVIENLLPIEAPEERPRAYLMLAENYFALKNRDKSLVALQKCINEFGTHPLSFQSRLNASRILSEQSKFTEAHDYLEQNLYDGSLSPDSPVWKESLFELGRNYYSQGEVEFSSAELVKQEPGDAAIETRLQTLESANEFFTKSINRLGEWLKRYPDDSRRFDTLYSIGKAYQMAAQYPEFLLKDGRPTSAEVRRQRLLEYRDLLQNARSTFEQIRTGINDEQAGGIRSQTFRSLLRNSYFAEADLTFQLQDYESALTLYRTVANRFLAEPESLEALTQAAECLKKLGRPEEGLRVISQAKEILIQIPPEQDARFISVTRFSRQQWGDLLSQMEKSIY